MATIAAIASGAFNAPATWTGGVIPGGGDVANLNGYVVSIPNATSWPVDQVIDNGVVGSGMYMNSPTASVTASGGLVFTSANTAYNTGFFRFGAGGVINADISWTLSSSPGGGEAIFYNAHGFTVNGSITITAPPGIAQAPSLLAATGSVTVNGNLALTNANVSSANSSNNFTGIVTINGNLTMSNTGVTAVGTSGGADAVVINGTFSVSNTSTNAVYLTNVFAADLTVVNSSLILTPFNIFQSISLDSFSSAHATNYGVLIVPDGTPSTIMANSGSIFHLPTPSEVVNGVNYLSGLTGNVVLPPADAVDTGTAFGPSSTLNGTLVLPPESDVLNGVSYGIGGNGSTGNVSLPAASVVDAGTTFGPSTAPISGTLTLPTESDVLAGFVYGVGGNSLVGNVVLPNVTNVASGVEYGPNGTSLVGALGAPPQGGNYCLVSDSYYNPDGSPYVGAVTVEILSLAANWPAGNNIGASMELATNSSGQLMDGTQPFVPLPYGASVQFSWGSITSGPWTVPSTPTATPPSFVGN